MNEQQKKLAFAHLMDLACLAYQMKKLSAETFALYWKHLKDQDIEAVAERLDRHIETEKFFPRIVDLREPPKSEYEKRMGTRRVCTIEDQRPSGRMSRKDWLKQQGLKDPPEKRSDE